jgi:hypothetical protein
MVCMLLSKQRNKHIERALVEAAKFAATEPSAGCDLRAGKAKRKWQSGDTRRSPENGRLSACRGSEQRGSIPAEKSRTPAA